MNNTTSSGNSRPTARDFFSKDGAPGFEIWGLDIGNQTLEKPRSQTLLEPGYVGRPGVRSEDDLTTGGLECVKRVEKFLLGSLLAGDKLDVIEEQEVDAAKGLAKGIHLFAPDAVD